MRVLAAVAVLVLVAACQAPPPAEMTDAERAQIEAEMEAIDDEFTATIIGWDLQQFLAFFSEDLTWAVTGDVHHSLASWVNQVTPFFEQAPSLERCDWVDRRYQVLTPGVVISTSDANCFGPNSEGSPLVIDHTWTVVWTNEGGQWKIVNLSESFPTPEEG